MAPDEIKTDIKSMKGESAGPHQTTVTAEQIRLFIEAIGAKDRGVAPPTFLTLYRKAEFELFERMGIALSQVLHAEQEYSYLRPIRAGDVLSFQTTLAQVLEKQGATGSLLFLGFETRFTEASPEGSGGEEIATSRTTVIVRRQA